MKRIFLSVASIFLLPINVSAQESGDPRTRDEDISATSVEVAVTRLPSGFYNYIYSLDASEENKGDVISFILNLACIAPPDSFDFPEPPSDLRVLYASENGLHAPFQMYHSQTGSTGMMVSVDNRAAFGVDMQPGESHTGFRILSPYPPTGREYELMVGWGFLGYDYDSMTDEEMQHVPWKHDFTVKGITQGPGCNAEPEPPALFAGSPEEPYNNLLQYGSPTRSAFHAEDDSVTFDIHYSEALLPESFKVEPGWARRHFSPLPGTHQVVRLKLHPGVNRFRFEGWKQGGHELDPMHENRNRYPNKDNDTFTIRRTPPGHDKEKTQGGKAK